MPVQACKIGEKPGFKWGESGKCYTYEAGNEEASKAAKKKALDQGLAIGEGKLLDSEQELSEITAVEIFAAGTWKGFKFVSEDLEEIASNSNTLLKKEENKPPLKLGHTEKQILKQEDGQPSLGWVRNFRTTGSKLIADLVDIPVVVMNALKKRLYKQLSVELSHSPHFGWFVKGLALLGADLPAVKSLQDLDAYLLSENLELVFSEPIIEKGNMEEKELLKKIEALEAEKKEFQQKEKELKFQSEKDKILFSFQEKVKQGILTPAIFKEIEEDIDKQKASFNDRLTISPEVVLKMSEQKETLLQQERVEMAQQKDGRRVDYIMDEKINEVIANTGKEYIDAVNIAFKANPDLAQEYFEWSNRISDKGLQMYA